MERVPGRCRGVLRGRIGRLALQGCALGLAMLLLMPQARSAQTVLLAPAGAAVATAVPRALEQWAEQAASTRTEEDLRKLLPRVKGQEAAAAEALLGLLGSGPVSEEQQARVQRALLALMPAALAYATSAFEDTKQPPAARAAAAEALAAVRGAKAVPLLASRLKDEVRGGVSELAPRLALALGTIPDPSAVEALEAVIDRPEPSFRWAVATALGRTGIKEAVPVLLRLLRDPDVAVEAAAHRALVRVTGLQRSFSPDRSAADRLGDLLAWESWWATASGRAVPPPQVDARPEASQVLRSALEWALNGKGAPTSGSPAFPALSLIRGVGETVVLDQNLPALLLPVEGHEILRMPGNLGTGAGLPRGFLRVEPIRIQGDRAEVTLVYLRRENGEAREYGADLELRRSDPAWVIDRVLRVWDPSTQAKLEATPPAPVLRRAPVQLPVAAVTVNLGQDAGATRTVLDILRRLQVPATFFATPEQLAKSSDMVKLVADQGHGVGLRCEARPGAAQTVADLVRELSRQKEAVQQVTGKPLRWLRPTADEPTDLLRAARATGLEPVAWSASSVPAQPAESAGPPAGRLLNSLHHGAILMFPDDDKALLPALTDVLQAIRRRGYRLLPLEELASLPATPATPAAPTAPAPEPPSAPSP